MALGLMMQTGNKAILADGLPTDRTSRIVIDCQAILMSLGRADGVPNSCVLADTFVRL